MKSAFGKKLFKLFLVISLAPAFLLTLIGYYLASENSIINQNNRTPHAKAVADYYNHLIFDKIKLEMEEFNPASSASLSFLDYYILYDNVTNEKLISGNISDSLVKLIIYYAEIKPAGFVEYAGRYYQYYYLDKGNDKSMAGGLIYDSSYFNLLSDIQSDYARVSTIEGLSSKYVYFLAVIFVFLGVITALLAYYFSSHLSHSLALPLTELSQASGKIAQGDFEQQVRVSGSGEVKELIEHFNMMASKLYITTNRLVQSERVAAWRHVARRFAHELKNPLQPIIISLYRIEKTLQDSSDFEKIKEPLRAASEELKHLTELADRFSQLAKLPPPNLQLIDMKEFLEQVSILYQEQLRPFDFTQEFTMETCKARIDVIYFREALHNLLQNAIDASSEGGKIILRLYKKDNDVIIEVQDFGKGMSKEVITSAKIPYFTTKEKGNGIGLAVVDKTMSEIKGDMTIISETNKGTTISLTIPGGKR